MVIRFFFSISFIFLTDLCIEDHQFFWVKFVFCESWNLPHSFAYHEHPAHCWLYCCTLLFLLWLGISSIQAAGAPGRLKSVKGCTVILKSSRTCIALVFLLLLHVARCLYAFRSKAQIFICMKKREQALAKNRAAITQWVQFWRWALPTAAEIGSYDTNKTFEILTAKLNILLKFMLGVTLHLFSLLNALVWPLSYPGVQLALRGSAVRNPIWEAQLILADSPCLLAKLMLLTTIFSSGCEEDVWKVFDSCLELMGPCWGDAGRCRCLSTFTGMVTAALLQSHRPGLCIIWKVVPYLVRIMNQVTNVWPSNTFLSWKSTCYKCRDYVESDKLSDTLTIESYVPLWRILCI